MSLVAFFLGLLGASSLALGAMAGVFLRPSPRLSAAIMAFGSGILLSAIAFDIALNIYEEQGFVPIIIGFLTGGFLFNNLTQYVDQHGGFLRKPAVSRRYLFEHQLLGQDVLERVAHIEVLQDIPAAEKQILAKLLQPVHVDEGNILCREGDLGDYFYMIVKGEAEVCKGEKIITTLKAGEIFGEMSLLTGEPRSATVIARTTMELYRLDQDNFAEILTKSPYLAWALSRTLARRLRLSVETQVETQRNLEKWRDQLLEQIELHELLREDPETLENLLQRSTPLAILVGTLLDNIPESMVIGMNSGISNIGWSFLVAVFISNVPEAFSSASGMKQAGTRKSHILALWGGVVIFSGFCAVAGYWLQNTTPPIFVATAKATAGGAILAMLANTMMPEAYELGGSSIAYSTIVGFLLGFFITSYSF